MWLSTTRTTSSGVITAIAWVELHLREARCSTVSRHVTRYFLPTTLSLRVKLIAVVCSSITRRRYIRTRRLLRANSDLIEFPLVAAIYLLSADRCVFLTDLRETGTSCRCRPGKKYCPGLVVSAQRYFRRDLPSNALDSCRHHRSRSADSVNCTYSFSNLFSLSRQ